MDNNIKDKKMQFDESIIIGRNAVMEAVRNGRSLDSILISKGGKTGASAAIVKKATDKGIIVKEVDSRKLDAMSNNGVHQGIIAVGAVAEYSTVEDIFENAKARNHPPFIIIADEIEDPHNLGALIRTAEASGADGIIIPKRRAVGLTYAVGKTSAGAVEYLPVARVTNLAATIDELKEKGLWIYGADMNGENWCSCDLKGAIGLVIGSEGFGIGRLIKEKCDVILSLPMSGKVNSLNASVAGGILMYEISRQRLEIKAKN